MNRTESTTKLSNAVVLFLWYNEPEANAACVMLSCNLIGYKDY
ncbi:MAG: hypothetical protein ACI4A3_08590 [Lachnospiraceae bacterium]